jgi:hypothetical protein
MSNTVWFYPIDWAATGAWMQAWAGFAAAAAVAFAAWLGRKTYSDWLSEKQTERKMVVGEQVLKVCLEAESIFQQIRSEFSFDHESAEVEAKIDAEPERFVVRDDDHKRRLITANMIMERMNQSRDFFESYFECLPLVRIYFGQAASTEFKKIWRTRAEIETALRMYASIRRISERDADRLLRYEEVFYQGEDDTINVRISELIEYFEALVSPLLTSGSK